MRTAEETAEALADILTPKHTPSCNMTRSMLMAVVLDIHVEGRQAGLEEAEKSWGEKVSELETEISELKTALRS